MATGEAAAPPEAPAATPAQAHRVMKTTTTERCPECEGDVRFPLGSPSAKAICWKMHQLTKQHKQHKAMSATQSEGVPAAAPAPRQENGTDQCVTEHCYCGGTIKYFLGCTNHHEAVWSQHNSACLRHRAAKRQLPAPVETLECAAVATAAMSEFGAQSEEVPAAAPAQRQKNVTNKYVTELCGCGGTVKYLRGCTNDHDAAWSQHTSACLRHLAWAKGQLPAPLETLECAAVAAAQAFARRHCFPGAFCVVAEDSLAGAASPLKDALSELKSTTFRRAALARDAIIDIVARTGHDFAESQLTIVSVPQQSLLQSQRSLSRREVPSEASGTKRVAVGALPFAAALPLYKLPADLRREIPYPDTEAVCRQRLQKTSYATDPIEHLHNLLYCEEACVRASLREYDIEEGVFSEGLFELYCLKVPGLAEKRPSVLPDDVIEACDPRTRRCYQGYVHLVHADEIHVSFDARDITVGQTYAIHFTGKLTEFRLLHRAVDRTKALGRPLLTAQHASPPPPEVETGNELTPDPLYDGVLAPLNELQRKFVEDACASKAVLRILWGPPGTGKTTTLVAYVAGIVLSALQSEPRKKGFRVLVATPSNGASNLITSKLLKFLQPKKQVLRVMAFSRQLDEVPDDVRECCCTASYEDSLLRTVTSFRSPDEAAVECASVIVATLGSCSQLYTIHPQLCFSHVIVDSEFAGALQFPGLERVTIAGDPKQLGPVTVGQEARSKGLGTSPLVRLIEHEEAPNTMLRECYRCHPDILSAFNPVFYKGELETPGAGVKFSRLPVPGFEQSRVQFHHCDGPEGYANNSPSIMNLHEVRAVANQLKHLRAVGVPLDDVVVLAPYALQVKKLREAFRFQLSISDRAWLTTHVCSVEVFQGREAKYVIISCVRSPEELSRVGVTQISADARRHLGFLSHAQRSNVVLSRAIDGLIVVGNLRLLWVDEVVWRPVIESLRGSGAEFLGAVTPTDLYGLPEAPRWQTAVDDAVVDGGDTTEHETDQAEEEGCFNTD
ncbi:ATP-dependent RNA helicase, putative [Bodo saltans]|uniref:RNA helicase n=1 Tax=Bodo saltans TaxID=75058 RepID=A0A0S4JDU9_BODSA|nr:ATP-dependent RNA helicase, putative [Bodo saltans]|eukprot:CUG86534.1 ATP-dependent RNA helicase, putative [Bodo saltans]